MIGDKSDSLADAGNYEMQLIENDRRSGREEDERELELWRRLHFAKMAAAKLIQKEAEEEK